MVYNAYIQSLFIDNKELIGLLYFFGVLIQGSFIIDLVLWIGIILLIVLIAVIE